MDKISTYPPQNVQGGPVTLGYAEVTAAQGSITTEVDLTGLSVTLTVPAGRRLRITGSTLAYNNTAGSGFGLAIQEGATQLNERNGRNPTANETNPFMVMWIGSPAAGTHTYKLTGRNTGGGVASTWASATEPAFILVEDITGNQLPVLPQSVPVGALAYAPTTANQTGIVGGSAVAITGLTANVVVPAGRTLRVTGFVLASSPSAGLMETTLWMDDAVIGRFHDGAVAAGELNSQTPIAIISPAAGSHTFDVRLHLGAGTGQTYADSIRPVYLLVEDVTPTPAPGQGAPGSTLGYAQVTTNQTGITTEVALAGLTTTVTVPAGRRVRITARCVAVKDATAGLLIGWIFRDGVRIGKFGDANMSANGEANWQGSYVDTPTAGAHTYSLTMRSFTTAGSMFADNSVDHGPAFILVEDITGAVWPVGSAVTAGMVASEPWTLWTPLLTQGVTVGATSTNSRCIKVGRTVHGQFRLSATGAGTAGQAIVVSIPYPAAWPGAEIGIVMFYDASGTRYICALEVQETDASKTFLLNDASGGNAFGALPAVTLASGDLIRGQFTYEAAS